MSGSGAAPSAFRHDLADATGRVVSFERHERDHSAVGAALFAGRGELHWPETSAEPPPETDVVEPDPARAEDWATRFERHDAACRSQGTRREERPA
jgi:sugar (pentulose or hexulose) kinase